MVDEDLIGKPSLISVFLGFEKRSIFSELVVILKIKVRCCLTKIKGVEVI